MVNVVLDKSKVDVKLEYLLDFGIIAIDKPTNLSSHQVAEKVAKILNVDKSGHSGTLDPKVTGVLPVALGRATRVMEILLKSSKAYVALMHIHQDVEHSKVLEVIDSFVGKITQLPPVRCAVKRAERERTIYSIKLLDHIDKDYLIEVYCEAGTYIRKLLHDIGEKLGVGAHMQELRRIKSSCFDEGMTHTLASLEDAVFEFNKTGDGGVIMSMIKPLSFCLFDYEKYEIKVKDLDKVLNGMTIGVTKKYNCDYVVLYHKDKVLGLAQYSNARLKPFRLYFTIELAKKYLK